MPGNATNRPQRSLDSRQLGWIAAAAGVLVLSLLAYGPSLDGEFVWDDRPLIVDNAWVQQADGLDRILTSSFWESGDRHDRFRFFYRPLIGASYLLDHLVWGLEPFGFRLTNLLWHLLCCLLLFGIARQEGLAGLPAWIGAGLFAVHPVHVESVAWISGRTDLICTALVLAAFLVYLRHRSTRSRPALVLSLVAFALALGAKEMAATLPLLIALDHWSRQPPVGRGLRDTTVVVLPYFAVLAAYLIVRQVVLGGSAQALYELPPVAWLASAIYVMARYLVLLLLPFGLDAHYPDPPLTGLLSWLVAISAVVLSLVGFAAWRLRGTRALFWLSWIPLTLLPVLSFGRFGDVLLADRFLYLPSVGLALLAARAVGVVLQVGRWRQVAVAVSCVLLPFLALLGAQRAKVWHDDLALFSDMVRTSPGSALVRCNLGLAHYRRGETDMAIREYREAIALVPGYSMAHNNLAAALEAQGRHRQALGHYLTAARLVPGHVESTVNAGHLMTRLGRPAEGLRMLRQSVERHPEHVRALYALGEALERLDGGASALAFLVRARNADPTYPNTWYLLGKIHLQQGRTLEASEELRTFLALWAEDDSFAASARAMLDSLGSMTRGSS